MPELPEAETIVRTLGPYVEGRRIRGVTLFTQRVSNGEIPDLAGRTVRRVSRYGKQIVWELDGTPYESMSAPARNENVRAGAPSPQDRGSSQGRGWLVIQLRMTGLLLWRVETGRHTRARFEFDHGCVCFDDIRQFGSVRYSHQPPDNLGPDPLEVTAVHFQEMLGRRRRLKPLLLDQRFLRGLGNIYVDEILYRARLHPNTVAARLGPKRCARLHAAMRETLEAAIANGGSSISDYVDANGQSGRFQLLHAVYGRKGEPCPRCGDPIRRIVVSQRGTHFCQRCQTR